MSWLRQSLMSAAGKASVRGLAHPAPRSVGLTVTDRPEDSTNETLAAASRLIAGGLAVSVHCLDERTDMASNAEATTARYLDLLGKLTARGLARHAEVSVNLSAIGQSVTDPSGSDRALRNAHKIATMAHQVGATVTLGMERYANVDATLGVLRELRHDFPETGVTLQAYLSRTEGDCRALSFEGSRVRLCKGAYTEREDVGFRTRLDIDRSFVRCLKVLLGGHGYPMIATHDPRMIQIAASLASRFGWSRGGYEFQMFDGIRSEEQRRLARQGETMRIHVPHGDYRHGYLRRRLAERSRNLSIARPSLTSKK
jgi:proline dehydrogenase